MNTRKNERRKARRSRQATVGRVRFATDDPGRPHPRAARASGARALHRARLSRDHYATDREEGGRGGGDDLPPFHEQAALLQRDGPHGGSLGGTASEGRRRPQGGNAGEASRARPGGRDGEGGRRTTHGADREPTPR